MIQGSESHEPDPVLGATCVRMAAERGDDFEAQFELGGLYFRGVGVAEDHVLAHMWYSLAVLQGSGPADRVGLARTIRDAIATLLSESELAESRRMTQEWLEGARER